jgi:thiol reductant ABC exporter CydD subunit
VRGVDSRLLRHSRATRRFLLASAALTLGSSALLIVAAFAISELVVAAFQDGADLDDETLWLFVLALVVLTRSVLAWAGQVAAHRAAADAKSQVRRELLAHTVRLGPAWLARHRAGDLTTVATRGIDELDGYFAGYLPALLAATVLPVTVLVVIATQDPISALIIAVTWPLIPLFGSLVGRGTAQATRRQWRSLALLGGHFLDVVQGLPTLLLFNRAKVQVATIRRRAEEHRCATMSTLRLAFLSSAALEFVATISVAVIAVSIGLRLVDARIDLGTALVVLILAPEAYWPLRQVAAQFHASAPGVAAAASAFDVLAEAVPVTGGGSAPVPELSRAALRVEGLRVEHDRDRPALADLDLVIRPGEFVGIAGASGSGKTTLLWVLLRFRSASAGRVVVDGPHGAVDLAELDPDEWRRQVAWVPQQPWLAPASILDNVRLVRPDADDTAVARALRMANATEFVAALPAGADTVLGENGHGLSAGQRQRIALARAFLRDAPLVLLDEPTAHLDRDNEAAISAAVRRLARNRTVVAVAHRPALLAGADRVIHLSPQLSRASA